MQQQIYQDIGKQIKEVREAKGITQMELSNKLGFNQAYLSVLEGGKIRFSLEKLNQIVLALECKVNIKIV